MGTETWSYATNNQVTIEGDYSLVYWPMMKVKIIQGTTKLFLITNVNYADGNTVLTFKENAGYEVADAPITEHYIDKHYPPKDFLTSILNASPSLNGLMALEDKIAFDRRPPYLEDYGAVGDGETDDSGAFQDAIDDFDVIGGIIFGTPGAQYLLSATVNMLSHVYLSLQYSSVFLDTIASLIGFDFNAAWNCGLRHGFIHTSAENQIAVNTHDSCAQIQFDHVFLLDDGANAGTKAIQIDQTWIANFVSCVAYNFANAINVVYGSDVNLIGCSLRQASGSLISIYSGGNVKMIGGDLEDAGNLVYVWSGDNIVLDKVWLENGWAIVEGGDVLFDGCYFNVVWSGIDNTPFVTYRDNYFNDLNSSSYDWPLIIRGTDDAAKIILHNNLISNPAGCLYRVGSYYPVDTWLPRSVSDIMDFSGDQLIYDPRPDAIQAIGYQPPPIIVIGGYAITFGTAAPVAGTWARGDICFRSDATASGPAGWMCTAAGTPGTWRAMANLASS